jgi:hypothetical protein
METRDEEERNRPDESLHRQRKRGMKRWHGYGRKISACGRPMKY